MPSPFPGMDPYLEGAEWMSFHAEFCVEIARQLRPKLRPRYIAQTIKRFVTDSSNALSIITGSSNSAGKSLYPDVGIAPLPPSASSALLSTTTLLEPPSLRAATVMPEIVPQYAVEIRDLEQRQLVTLIEVLSPANKQGEGHDEYRAKRQRVLLSTAHLLEIDFLRKGQRVPMRQPLPASPYFVFLSRQQNRPITEIWQIALNQKLPVVPVPLLPKDADVGLDLAQAFTNVYDSVGYDLLINYNRPPEMPLDKKDAAWVVKLLAQRG